MWKTGAPIVRRPFDHLIRAFLTAFLVVIIPCSCVAQGDETQKPQKPTKEDPARQHAMELYSQGRFVEAMPLFETLVADHPSDVGCGKGGRGVCSSMRERSPNPNNARALAPALGQ